METENQVFDTRIDGLMTDGVRFHPFMPAAPTNEESEEVKMQQAAKWSAAVQMLDDSDFSRMDDNERIGMFRATTKAMFGIEDADGSFSFGKKKGTPEANLDNLRKFAHGDYSAILSDEFDAWAKMDDDQRFQYALEHETKSNKVKSNINGDRGDSLFERVLATAGAVHVPGTGTFPTGEQYAELDESNRRSTYERMTPEEQEKYRADVINDYSQKISKDQPLATFLMSTKDMSDRAQYLLVDAYNRGDIDVDAMQTLDEGEREQVYTTLSAMRGDQKSGRPLGIQTDFTDDTAMNRLQLALYGLQQAHIGLVTESYETLKDAGKWIYYEWIIDKSRRQDAFDRWNAEERAKRALKQGLPEADTWGGLMLQGLAENSHWYWGYRARELGTKLFKEGAALAKGAKAGKDAMQLVQMRNIGLGMSNYRMLKGASEEVKKVFAIRNAVIVEQHARDLERLNSLYRKGRALEGLGAGAYLAGRAMTLSSFVNEYMENADAAGISREVSFPTALMVGYVNDMIESIYVLGLEKNIAPDVLKGMTLGAMYRMVKRDGFKGFRQYVHNSLPIYLGQVARVATQEGVVEETLQQQTIELGELADEMRQFNKELDEKGVNPELKERIDAELEDFWRNRWKTFVDTAVDSAPTSLAFGLTSTGNMQFRQWARGQWARLTNKNKNRVNFDEGVAAFVARKTQLKDAIYKYWSGSGENEEAMLSDEDKDKYGPELEQGLREARKIVRRGTGDIARQIADTMNLDIRGAELVEDYLRMEDWLGKASPTISNFNQATALVDVSEDTIPEILPGYVKGTLVKDDENGVYTAQYKVGDETRKVTLHTKNTADKLIEFAMTHPQQLQASYNALRDKHPEYNMRPWDELVQDKTSFEKYVREHVPTGYSTHVLTVDADGKTVAVPGEDVIYLLDGRGADVGYRAATMEDARHEVFHPIWTFLRSTAVSKDEVKSFAQKYYPGLDIDTEAGSAKLDEDMAYEYQQYASGNYVSPSVSDFFHKIEQSGMGKFLVAVGRKMGLVDEVVDLSGSTDKESDDYNPNYGKPFTLRNLYDAIMRGEVGTGWAGVKQITGKQIPKVERKTTAKPEAPTGELPDVAPTGTKPPEEPEATPTPTEAPKPAPSAPTPSAPVKTYTAENPAPSEVPDAKFYRIQADNEGRVFLVGELEVAEAEDSTTSYNEGYSDPDLQNRGTGTEDSIAAAEKIAGNLDPRQTSLIQPRANNGIKWVTPSGMVFIGNTRTRGEQLAYERGTANGLAAFVRAQAVQHGLVVPEGMKHPTLRFKLIRVESADGKSVSMKDVVRMTNENQQRGMNEIEQAGNDAQIVENEGIAQDFVFRADGRIDETKSGDAIGKFRQATGMQGMVGEDGLLTEAGEKRLMNAVIASLIGNDAKNRPLLQKIFRDAGRLDMRSQIRALVQVAPMLKGLGYVRKMYDLTGDLADALRLYVAWRDEDENLRIEKGKSKREWRELNEKGERKRGISWERHIGQGDMFEQPSEASRVLADLFAASEKLRSFDKEDNESEAGKARAVDLIKNYLQDYVTNAWAANPEVDMFGQPGTTKEQMLRVQREKNVNGTGAARFSVQQPHGMQKDANVDYPEARAEIVSMPDEDKGRFSFASEAKALILKKRPDLDDVSNPVYQHDYVNSGSRPFEKVTFNDDGTPTDEFRSYTRERIVDATVSELMKFPDSKTRKAALHWFVSGAIILPEDSLKVTEAIGYANHANGKANTDALSYASPMEMIEALHQFKPMAKPINPDEVPQLSDRRDMGNGVVTYLVQDDREGQQAMRTIINTHWGEDANPWCLLQGDGHGHLTDEAWRYWQHYDALPKRVAFKDGKLLAFMATDRVNSLLSYVSHSELAKQFPDYVEEWRRVSAPTGFRLNYRTWLAKNRTDEFLAKYPQEEQWWDRKDVSHDHIPFASWSNSENGAARFSVANLYGTEGVETYEDAVKRYVDLLEEQRRDFARMNQIADEWSKRTGNPLTMAYFGNVRAIMGEEFANLDRKWNTALANPFDILVGRFGSEVAEEAERLNAERSSGTVIPQVEGVTDGVDANGAARFSAATYKDRGRKILSDFLDKEVRFARLSKKEAKEILHSTDTIYDLAIKYAKRKDLPVFANWCKATVEVDEDGNPYFGVIRTNGEYVFNVDFSTVCKKRRPLDYIFRELVRQDIVNEDNITTLLSEKKIPAIQDIIKAHGLEIACALCFVDSKRYKIGEDLKKFANLWNSLVDGRAKKTSVWKKTLASARAKVAKKVPRNYAERVALAIDGNPNTRQHVNPTDLLNSDSFAQWVKDYPDIYAMFRSFKGQSKAKDSAPDVPYNSDIITLFNHTLNDKVPSEITPEQAFAVGGVRIQSFSDFVAMLAFDYVQLFADLAARRLPLQAYTKEVDLVKLFGKTGAKINMSLVPAGTGFNEDGSYAFADECFPPEEAFRLRDAEGNVGTIMVGISDEHIRRCLNDDRIDQVIPYHKSSINPAVALARAIDTWTDYTNFQHTKGAPQEFDFYGDMAKTRDPRKTASNYLSWCRKNGYQPKFPQFANEKNYYKLLADFRLYNAKGEYAPQVAVHQVVPDATWRKNLLAALQHDQTVNDDLKREAQPIIEEIKAKVFGLGDGRFSVENFTGTDAVDPNILSYKERRAYYQRLTAQGIRNEDPEWTKPLSEKEWADAKKYLGIVKDIEHATFITPDGELLGSAGSEDRIVHGKLGEVVVRPLTVHGRILTHKDGSVFSDFSKTVRSAIKSGAIRLDSGRRGIQIEAKRKLTDAQIDRIYDYVEWANGETGPNGFFVDYAENGIADVLTPSAFYRKGTSAFVVLTELQDYRERGILPKGNEASYGRFSINIGPNGLRRMPGYDDAVIQLQNGINGNVGRRELWQRTGWWKGPDKMWRKTISGGKLKDGFDKAKRLELVLDAPELFAAYPDLKKMPVRDRRLHGSTMGEFTGLEIVLDFEKIMSGKYTLLDSLIAQEQASLDVANKYLNDSVIASDDELRSELAHQAEEATKGIENLKAQIAAGYNNRVLSTLTHEIQHYVQAKEGFAHGSSVDYEKDYVNDEVVRIGGRLDKAIHDMTKLYKIKDESRRQKEMERLENVIAECRAKLDEFERVIKNNDYFNLYYRSAGETEARYSGAHLHNDVNDRTGEAPWEWYNSGKEGSVAEAAQIVRFSAENAKMQHVSPEEWDAAKQYFGVTDDAFEAGWILPDGSMLDFGEKNNNGPAGVRTRDHRQISVAIDRQDEPGEHRAAMQAALSSGAMRLYPEMPGVEIRGIPTSEALWTLREAFDQLKNNPKIDDWGFTVEFSVPYMLNGEPTDSFETKQVVYSSHTDSSRVANDVREFFQTGELPEGTFGEGDYGRFATSMVGEAIEKLRFKQETERMRRLVTSRRTTTHGLKVMSRPGYFIQPWSVSDCSDTIRDLLDPNHEYNLAEVSRKAFDFGNEYVANGARMVLLSRTGNAQFSQAAQERAAREYFASRNSSNEDAKTSLRRLLSPYENIIRTYQNQGRRVVLKPVVPHFISKAPAYRNRILDKAREHGVIMKALERDRLAYLDYQKQYSVRRGDPVTAAFGRALAEDTGAVYDEGVMTWIEDDYEARVQKIISRSSEGIATKGNDVVILIQGIAADGNDIYSSVYPKEKAANVFLFARRGKRDIRLVPNDIILNDDETISLSNRIPGDIRSLLCQLFPRGLRQLRSMNGFGNLVSDLAKIVPGGISGGITLENVSLYLRDEAALQLVNDLIDAMRSVRTEMPDQIDEDDEYLEAIVNEESERNAIRRNLITNRKASRSDELPYLMINQGADDAVKGIPYNKAMLATNFKSLIGGKGTLVDLGVVQNTIALYGESDSAGYDEAYRYLQAIKGGRLSERSYDYIMAKAMGHGKYEDESRSCAFRVVERALSPKFVRQMLDSIENDSPVQIVYACHRDGRNKIPGEFARILSDVLNANGINSSVQKIAETSNRHASGGSEHNGDAALTFDGRLVGFGLVPNVDNGFMHEQKVQAVIVDDVFTTGNSLVSLMDYVLKDGEGGVVIKAVATLACGRHGSQLFATEDDLTQAAARDKIDFDDFKKALPYDRHKLLKSEIPAIPRGWQALLSELGSSRALGRLQLGNGESRAGRSLASGVQKDTSNPGKSDSQQAAKGGGNFSVDPGELVAAKEIDAASSPRFSILNRQIVWSKLPRSLETVANSTSLAHLESADRNKPARDRFYELMGDRVTWGTDKPEAERFARTLASQLGTEWLGKYLLAKHFGGDEEALEVVKHFVKPGTVNLVKSYRDPGKKLKIAYVHSREGESLNRLPFAYAALLEHALGEGVEIDNGIVKVSTDQNTRAQQRYRVSRDFAFESEDGIDPDAQYLIVDDTWTSGQTSVSLLDYLEQQGADVLAISTIATGRYGKKIIPTNDQLQRAVKKAKLSSVEQANQVLGFDLGKATGSELHGYILQGKQGPAGLQNWFSEVNAPMLPGILPSAGRGDVGNQQNAADSEGAAGAESRLGATGTEPTYNGQPYLPGFGRFSAAYPQFNGLTDDQLMSLAVATDIALGKSDKVSDRSVKVARVAKLVKGMHPDYTTQQTGVESLRVISDAQKIAKRLREDLDRGVSQSVILQHLPDTYRDLFGVEMREQARRGSRIGAQNTRAYLALRNRRDKLIDDAVRAQTGVETKLLEDEYGIDLSKTLLALMENPMDKPPPEIHLEPTGAKIGTEEENEGEKKDVSEEVKRLVEDVVNASKKSAELHEQNKKNAENARKAAEENAKESEAEEGGEEAAPEANPEGVGDPDIVEQAVRKAQIDLENPRHLAEFVVELSRRYWIGKHSLALDANPWIDNVAVQFLRKTAQNIYAKLVRDLTFSGRREAATKAIRDIVNIPTVNGILSELTYIGSVIHAQRIRDKRREMCEQLDQFLQDAFGARGRFKPDQESIKRKVSAEAELRARYMRHAMWLTPTAVAEETQNYLEAINQISVDFDAEGKDKDQSREMQEAIRNLGILREFGGLVYKMPSEIEAAAHYWKNLADTDGGEVLAAINQREERTVKAASVLAQAFRNAAKKYRAEGVDFASKMSDYLQSHMGFINLIRDMMRYAPEEDRAIAEQIVHYLELEIQKSGTRAMTGRREQGTKFAQALESIYGKSFDEVIAEFNALDERFEPFMGTTDGKKVMPTKGRAIQLLVSLLQVGRKVDTVNEDGETVAEWIGGYHDNIVKHHREGQAEQIMALLTPEDLNLIDWLGRWYEDNRASLSSISEQLFGIGVHAETSNYLPVKMLLPPQGLEKGGGVAWTIFPKALTPRVKNERDFDTSADILQLFMARMEEAEQWKAHAKLGLELRGIFGRQILQEAVIANHSKKTKNLLLGFITDILAGSGASERDAASATYWTDKIRGWAALGALGGNLGVMLRQTTSIPAFGFEIGLIKTGKYILSAFTPDGMAAMRAIFDSEERKNRWQIGNTEEVKNALAQNNSSAIMKLMKASMITNRLGDVVPALVVGQGVYRDALEQGMSEEDAMAFTWMLVERTQQSGRIENQAQFQRRTKYGKALYQFLSTQQQYLQYEALAIRNVAADPKNGEKWGKIATALALNHFVLGSLYFWMGELYKAILGQKPPEDELAEWVVTCLLGPYGALYGIGWTTAEALNRWICGNKFGNQKTLPSLSYASNVFVNDPAAVIESVFSREKTWDDVLNSIGKWLSDFNSTFRDMRKIYRYRIKNEPQK